MEKSSCEGCRKKYKCPTQGQEPRHGKDEGGKPKRLAKGKYRKGQKIGNPIGKVNEKKCTD